MASIHTPEAKHVTCVLDGRCRRDGRRTTVVTVSLENTTANVGALLVQDRIAWCRVRPDLGGLACRIFWCWDLHHFEFLGEFIAEVHD